MGANFYFFASYFPLILNDFFCIFAMNNYNIKKPGNEFLLTSGIDYRLTESMSVSGDLIYIIYGTDNPDSPQKFSPGNMTILNLQVRKYFGYDELAFFARYRTRGKNEFSNIPKSTPDQSEAILTYRRRINERFYIKWLLDVKKFEGMAFQPPLEVHGAGFAPEIIINPNWRTLTIPFQT